MRGSKTLPKIAVVIATKDRYRFLSERSLPSIVLQTRRPDFLVLVDDSSPEVRVINAQLVSSLNMPECEVAYIENGRSEGASGSWNSASDFLCSKDKDPEGLYIAFLDDDDAWSPMYLDSCYTAAIERELDMVATDLNRIEYVGGYPCVNKAPEQLCADDFLTGNPGIQGSNLFLRLSVLLAAGGFDEALQSTTDRDLCIRIADLGSVRYGRIPIPLVDHYADSERPRLSTPGSRAKIDGLTAFWQKYLGRMTISQRAVFIERATALFGWRPPNDPVVSMWDIYERKRALVLGLVVYNERPDDILRIVQELASCTDQALVGLDVVLLEDGQSDVEPSLLARAASILRDSGKGSFRFCLERQKEDSRAGLFYSESSIEYQAAPDLRHQMLSVYCGRVAASRTGTEVWIAKSAECKGCPEGGEIDKILCWLQATREESTATPIQDAAGVIALDQWIQSERVSTAGHRIRRRFALDHLRLLGCGSEAVVFTDEIMVYKCIDYWKTRMPQSQLEFLRSQVGRWADMPGLYVLRDVLEDGPWVILTYDYERSSPYQGGHESDLIRLLNSCSVAGIVCNNIHPKNLVVTSSGVKLIDYGSDIRAWTALGFEHMARKAFLACRHAAHPGLGKLMRLALSNDELPEMAGYKIFRERLEERLMPLISATPAPMLIAKAPPHQPFRLYVGVISSDPMMLKPLLHDLVSLQGGAVREMAIVVLNNGCPPIALDAVVSQARNAGLQIVIVSEEQQRRDAASGGFGAAFRDRPVGQVGIARARTMLQRYLGAFLKSDKGSFGWVLDDDMRVDERAKKYLPWLPAFREQGTDVLIGVQEGASPNPPLNGLRVHLVDLIHNIYWLRNLPDNAVLPNRAAENKVLRDRYPDYYYDLSRKHTGHLEMPHWLEPVTSSETVREAYSRLLSGAVNLLNGFPLTRPIIASAPMDPLISARASVNRGGCTFIINHRALSETPNMIASFQGREARRSDMIWAIVNRHYRGMNIQAVDFPAHHVGRVNMLPNLNVKKVQGEIIGSTIYAGMMDFLNVRPDHDLAFSSKELDEICRLVGHHLGRRWRMLEQNFYRIAGLRASIGRLVRPGELTDLLRYLAEWFTTETFDHIQSGVGAHENDHIREFLASLRGVADDYAAATEKINVTEARLADNGIFSIGVPHGAPQSDQGLMGLAGHSIVYSARPIKEW